MESPPWNIHLSKHPTAGVDGEILKDREWALGISPTSTELPPMDHPIKE